MTDSLEHSDDALGVIVQVCKACKYGGFQVSTSTGIYGPFVLFCLRQLCVISQVI